MNPNFHHLPLRVNKAKFFTEDSREDVAGAIEFFKNFKWISFELVSSFKLPVGEAALLELLLAILVIEASLLSLNLAIGVTYGMRAPRRPPKSHRTGKRPYFHLPC